MLAHAKRQRPGVLTKTSLMLGLGESDAEIIETMDDLRPPASTSSPSANICGPPSIIWRWSDS